MAEALNESDVLGAKVSAASIEQLSEEASKASLSSDASSPPGNPVFMKWNNPGNTPPKINFFKFIAATRAWQRRAKENKVVEKSTVYYENTYRMVPDRRKYFAASKVEKLLKETLEKRLKSVKYSPDGCRITTRELCADIKRKIKEMDFPRYKIISEVLITENKRQGIQVSSRSLWNASTDNFATYTYKNATLIAVANVNYHALVLEEEPRNILDIKTGRRKNGLVYNHRPFTSHLEDYLALKEYKASKASLSSGASSPPGNPVFMKWNNPGNTPPKINFFKFIAATRAWQRRAKENKVVEKSTVYYENTYRMVPDRRKYFAASKVEKLLKETLEKRLKSVKYSPDGCRITTRELCADIKRKVKEMDFPRFKIISEVLITENKRQGIQVSSRSLWNACTDNFATYTYKNATLIAVANVYGVYYE